jgi:hypothetical protein
MKYSTLVVVPVFLFLFLLFSVGEFGYSLPMDVTDDSEHAETSLETRQTGYEGSAAIVCKSTLLLYVTILLVNEFYLPVGAFILGGIGFGLYELGEQIKNCEKQHELESTFTQAVVQNISGELPKWNVIMYHDDNSVASFYNYTSNSTELDLHCFFKHQGYTIYIFEWGNFTLAGDGGFENWCFTGSYQQNGNQVTFYSMDPTPPASQYFLLNNDFKRHIN